MNGKTCRECPYTLKAPRTVEGRAALEILQSAATWARAGLSGVETGLDLAACDLRIPGDVDAHAVRRLLIAAEPQVLETMARRREELKPNVQT